jgi:hypothetical protein
MRGEPTSSPGRSWCANCGTISTAHQRRKRLTFCDFSGCRRGARTIPERLQLTASAERLAGWPRRVGGLLSCEQGAARPVGTSPFAEFCSGSAWSLPHRRDQCLPGTGMAHETEYSGTGWHIKLSIRDLKSICGCNITPGPPQ